MRYALIALFFMQACSDLFMEDPIYHMPVLHHDASPVDNEVIGVGTQGDYENLCIRTEYYFCPGVSGPLMRIEITKDVCVDPPLVLSMSECKEYLECDPHYYNMGEKYCVTEDGTPGAYTEYCVKGFIKQGPCEASQGQDTYQDIVTVADNESDSKDEAGSSMDVDQESCALDAIDDVCDKKDVDVLVIIDLSASMIPEIQSVYNAVESFSIEHKEADHVNWALIVGPKNTGNKPGSHNFLYLASNLKSIDSFQDALAATLTYDMVGQYEMLYDALYLSLRNISSFLPYQWEELLWPVWVGNVIDESVPPLGDFYVNWREDSKKIIVVFTDEPGQSFLIPASKVGKSYNTNDTITQDKLLAMLKSIKDIRLYAFTDTTSDKLSDSWSLLTDATSGMTFGLDLGLGATQEHFGEILDSEICIEDLQ